MGKIRNFCIKALGGYTKKEYNRVESKYQGLLDSKTDSKTTFIANEYMMRILKDLDNYARTELYGIPTDSWASKMYYVIHNNMLRIIVRYISAQSPLIYKLDTTLDSPNQFANILKVENNEDDMFILQNNDYEI